MRRAAILAALAAASCVTQRPVSGSPAAEKGMLQYQVGRLTFLLPDAWGARGDGQRLAVAHPDDAGRLDVQRVEKPFRDEQECLADGDGALARGASRYSNVRRHPSSFAGRKAIAQEADQPGWHGWGWAVCDGGEQYRIFFAGRTPLAPDVLAAWRAFTRTAALGGGRS